MMTRALRNESEAALELAQDFGIDANADANADLADADLADAFLSDGTWNEATVREYIPSYVRPGSWRPWDAKDPCPAGYTCTVMGNSSFGAFSCDEMARIGDEVFGFGNVLAGTYCPEGEMGVLNCAVGGYCPDSKTRVPCPAGRFCPHKTYEDSFEGGSSRCLNCPEGSEEKRLSNTQRIVQVVFFCVFLVLLLLKIFWRKVKIDQEMLKRRLKIDSIRSKRGGKRSSMTAVKREEEKYHRLRPKLELIATRLDRVRHGKDPQSRKNSSNLTDDDVPTTPSKSLCKATSILYLSKHGDIIFDANDLYDVLDTDNDGLLSFSELNEVLCLKDQQLRGFIASMRGRMPPGFSPDHYDKVSRAVFVKNFLDVLADASELEPTEEDAADLFDRIVEEVGVEDSEEVPYDELYNSSLSLFLSDLQIHSIIKRFKQQQDGKHKGISKPDFVKHYPLYLSDVTRPGWKSESVTDLGANDLGLDVAFEDLCLTVKVGKREVNVVDHVSGRLRSNTMTAFMGGSGCGKSSFLNALCGRAYYGRVTGTVKINGNDSSIEDHKALIGFVPQDDIVYPELTVRENLLYSGRLQLPAGTPEAEIAELADTTMASLGLSRIANSPVGDASRRGISGGEKKRVNIGLELMKRPKILFLDEPTSGLDSRSAFVVMESLKNLVKTQGMTVASVIHQPRTDIYDMFDSLFLLGVGGRTVFHGPGTDAKEYFENLGYQMKEGESQADWFLDISSGDIEPDDIEAEDEPIRATTSTEYGRNRRTTCFTLGSRFEVSLILLSKNDVGFALGQPDGIERGNFEVKEVGKVRYARVSTDNSIQVGDKVVGINGRGIANLTMADAKALLFARSGDSDTDGTVFVQLMRPPEESAPEDDAQQESERKTLLVSTNMKPAGKEDESLAKARAAREKLYRHFDVHYENLPSPAKAELFDPPNPFPLPETPKAVSGGRQLFVQLRRNCLLSWRNKDSKIIEFGILIIAVFAMTLLGGVNAGSWSSDPKDLMWVKWIASAEDASQMLQPLVFFYAFQGVNAITNYSMMVGLIVSVLIGLNATKVITDKTLMFFREAQSGISVTAFYTAATVTATFEQGFSAIMGSILAFLILKPDPDFPVFLWNFFLLSWLSVSWAILLSIITPVSSVPTVVGFFNAFFGLLFCGRVSPGLFTKLYSNAVLAVFSGFVSPLRFFVEGIAVSEAQCLPIQSGYTVASDAFHYPTYQESYSYSYPLTFMAQTDLGTAITQNCTGWFWWVPATFAVGITIRIAGLVAVHFSGRSQQGKKSFREDVVDDYQKCRAGKRSKSQSFILASIVLFLSFTGFFVLSCWLILRENPEQSNRFLPLTR